MDAEEFDGMMEELNNEETTVKRKTEILQNVRGYYSESEQKKADYEEKVKTLSEKNHDLLETNHSLFNLAGVKPKKEEEQEKKTVSESIRISDFEKQLQNK